jgi:hypothetical protein
MIVSTILGALADSALYLDYPAEYFSNDTLSTIPLVMISQQ